MKNPENFAAGIVSSKEKEYAKKRIRLSELEKLAYQIGQQFEIKGEVLYPATLKELLEAGKPVVKKNIPKNVKKDLDYHWQECLRANQDHWGASARANYNLAHRHLLEYAPSITPADINEQFVKNFLTFLSATKRIENRSIANNIKYLRHLLKHAGLRYDWVKGYPETKEEPVEPHTWEEIMALYNLDLEHVYLGKVRQVKNSLAAARDRYVFVCLTGPRFSDTQLVDEVNVSEAEVDGRTIKILRYRQQKTRQWATIALHPIAEEIINRYVGKQEKLLPEINHTMYGTYIKMLGEMAGLNRPIKRIKYIGRERIETVEPLWKVMSSHFARATWATLMLEAGMDITQVQKLGGWSDLKTVMKYARVRPTKLHQATIAAWDRLGK